jgi:hypothetical protein
LVEDEVLHDAHPPPRPEELQHASGGAALSIAAAAHG